MKKKKQISLRSGLVTTVLLCWMLPMIFMLMMGVILLGRSYRKSARESVDADATLVMQQINYIFTSTSTGVAIWVTIGVYKSTSCFGVDIVMIRE